MKEAMFYRKLDDDRVQCNLCPHKCILQDGQYGRCRVRTNHGGMLFTEVYDRISSLHVDHIEKKPLYDFFPGSMILSVGSVGCNLRCKFCQNWQISQCDAKADSLRYATVDEIVTQAVEYQGNLGIAFTYNEPTVWYEFMHDVAKAISAVNLKNIMVTNGFINKEPLEKLFPYMDAFSVDLKAFSEAFYQDITCSRLEPVLETIKRIRTAGKHLELVFLVIPKHNDEPQEFEKMIDWIVQELGSETILHLSRYFPMYQMNEPITPLKTMQTLYNLATKRLANVYPGNV